MISVFFRGYLAAAEDFENVSQKVLDALAADEAPSGDLLAAEQEARETVVAARRLLMAEIKREEEALRSEWPLSSIGSSEGAAGRH
jgi:hypothetical protein